MKESITTETKHIPSLNRVVNVKTDDCGCVLDSIRGKIEVFKVGKKGKGAYYGIRGGMLET